MASFEYTAVPAPLRSEKIKSAKSPAERYAATLTETINQMAAQGWEYLRAETLPSEERSGLTGRTTLFHNLLIFRRETAASRAASAAAAAAQPAAQPAAPVKPVAAAQPATQPLPAAKVEPAPAPQPDAAQTSPVFSEKPAFGDAPRKTEQAPVGTKPAD